MTSLTSEVSIGAEALMPAAEPLSPVSPVSVSPLRTVGSELALPVSPELPPLPVVAVGVAEGLASALPVSPEVPVAVAIESPVEVIIDRIRARARGGDVFDDEELARQVLAAEMGLNEPEHGHNIAECIAMADVRLNNAGSLPQLRAAVATFVDQQPR